MEHYQSTQETQNMSEGEEKEGSWREQKKNLKILNLHSSELTQSHYRHWGHTHKALWHLGSGTTLQPRRVWLGCYTVKILGKDHIVFQLATNNSKLMSWRHQMNKLQTFILRKLFQSSEDLALDSWSPWHWRQLGTKHWLILATSGGNCFILDSEDSHQNKVICFPWLDVHNWIYSGVL